MSSRNDDRDSTSGESLFSDQQLEELAAIAEEAVRKGIPAKPRQAGTAGGGDSLFTEIRAPETPDEANAMMAELFRLAGIETPPTPITVPAALPPARSGRLAELHARAHATADNARDGYTKTAERIPTEIPLSDIKETRVSNIRVQEDEAAFESLRDSMAREGQLQEIVVVADVYQQGKYERVTGSRRLRAAAALGWPTIKALVLPAGTTDEELHFANAVENTQRFKLSSFEIASRAQLMRDRFRTPLDEFARRLGLSKSRVENLVRYLEHLPPDILVAWRAHDRFLSDHMLDRLSHMPPDKASVFWAEWRARQVANLARPPGERSQARRSRNRPTTSMLSRLWGAVKESPNLDEETRELLAAVVEFCAGFAATVPGVFDPKHAPPTKRGGPDLRAKAAEKAEPELKPADFGLPELDLPDLNADGTMPIPFFPEDDEPEDDEP
jgi:ParB/RepB/Spo0J family partition protein